MTDTSEQAAQERAQKQLTKAMADMVTQASTRPFVERHTTPDVGRLLMLPYVMTAVRHSAVRAAVRRDTVAVLFLYLAAAAAAFPCIRPSLLG